MKEKLTIALVAHDNRKADMVDWAKYNAEYLSRHKLVCTGTTGGLIRQAFDASGVSADIQCMNSGPMGGDAEIAALVVRHQVDLAVFLIDDLNAQPHEADIQMLLRQCRPHDFQHTLGKSRIHPRAPELCKIRAQSRRKRRLNNHSDG